MPFYALYVLELGGDYAMIGKILGVSALIKIVPLLIGGYLTDRVGRKRILYTFTYLLASVSLIRAFAPDYRFLLMASVLEALFMGIRGPSMNSIIADSTNPDNRSLSFALWTVIPSMVGVLSPSIFGVVVDNYGIRTAMMWGYITIFVFGSISAFIRQRYVKETLAETKKVKPDTAALKELIGGFGETIRSLSRGAVIFLSLDFIFTLALGMVDPYIVTFATDHLGLSMTQWGAVVSLSILVNCGANLLVANPSDSQGRAKFVLVSMIGFPITYFMLINTGSYLQFMLARIAVTIAAGIGQPAWHALFVDYCPREHRGRYNALLEIAWSVLYGGGNWLGGVLSQEVGLKAPFQWSIGMMAAGAVLATLFLREPEIKAE
jgi:MFS family permease